MKLPGHPSTHGHHVNPWACGSGQHRVCTGFSGGYDTYRCHDFDSELSDTERAHVRRLRGETP